MAMEQDYVMRMIKDFVRMLAKLLLNKDIAMVELDAENPVATTGLLHQSLISMADNGYINEAENQLDEKMESGNKEYLELALRFYMHINEYDDDFLEDHNYSREEIKEGLQRLGQAWGITGLPL